MKKISAQLLIICTLFLMVSTSISCKSKSNESETTTAPAAVDSPAAAPAAPVVISGDDELKKGVMDATKDYTTVKADVTDSVINLSGEIKRADWQKLNPTLNTLHPKKINSENLTIK